METRETRFDRALRKAADGSTIVAHYTKKDTFLEYILPTQQLRLGRLSNTNDPRESKEWSFPSLKVDYKESEDWASRANMCLNTLLRDRCYVACGTLNQPERMDCYLRPRMWAQYGDNHRGVCLLLSAEAMETELSSQISQSDRLYSRPVDYFDSFPFEAPVPLTNPIEQRVKDYLIDEKHRLYFLYGKHPDWAHENEHRWVVVAEDNQSSFYYVSLGKVLLGVVLGVDWPEVYTQLLKQKFPQSSGVVLGRVKWTFMDNPQVWYFAGERAE